MNDYTSLPVYEQKQRILDTLAVNQVIVVQSPTGSGKTTQIPVILHEAGFSAAGMIAVTQPRRIAALSVSEFIAKQLKTTYPGLVGYKMRFEDKTDATTRIKIMTDGILLQEMKLDPWLSKYSVVMVDEAHERSLNIDFVLGLLKRVLAARQDFKVIVSSATMNAEAFSTYFDGCPIVTIDTVTYPVTIVYDPPAIPASTASPSAAEALLAKMESTIDRVLDNHDTGDILCFLPGEKIIKDCIRRLAAAPFGRKIHLIPLYGRLAKDEQERVFETAPFGRKKVIVSTNIAETSVTIPGITTVIDSGLAKLNYYNPRTYTASLNETPVSKASCNQRKGRAGRTQSGTCYRLYTRKDFETRQTYTTEEIYRTDLSEVVLRMAELGITDFEQFDFIAPPGHEGMVGAVETLGMLKALESDNSLSAIGKLMVQFPLVPRVSRIIVEAILRYPDVLEEALIAAAFLSAQSPFVLPPGEETDARKAHHTFRDIQGDFVSYVKLFRTYTSMKNASKFCKSNYLDERVMAEILNIKIQLEQIVTDMEIPVTGGGSMDDYLCCISAGMIQFVCVREGKENYRSLTAEHIQIHPGSSMFRADPLFIVAGEIVRTSRMFAMSVSPLTRNLLARIDPDLETQLSAARGRNKRAAGEKPAAPKNAKNAAGQGAGKSAKDGKPADSIRIGGTDFAVEKIKGKKNVILPFAQLQNALANERDESRLAQTGGLRAKIKINGYELLAGEKAELVFRLAKALDLTPLDDKDWNRKLNVQLSREGDAAQLIRALDLILKTATAKTKSKELGFICLFTDGHGSYWFKVSRGFATALNESLSSLETLIDETAGTLDDTQKTKLNAIYRKLNDLYE
ncbi:helicase-related protein [Treponema brennaborense]|uniref:Helicase domain-containing protein n=1 Tax=Treponema brennaborense (strain DSM 12168 / CIP 105900 / DD5/3) TaxID=906968 RepID=F4LN62_TREBD|nr:ATP-dependent RNA helicase [Treponema brennaborense]AEE16827.1 helicase domain-containing protein [Treponema brennaborense DSM 12168]